MNRTTCLTAAALALFACACSEESKEQDSPSTPLSSVHFARTVALPLAVGTPDGSIRTFVARDLATPIPLREVTQRLGWTPIRPSTASFEPRSISQKFGFPAEGQSYTEGWFAVGEEPEWQVTLTQVPVASEYVDSVLGTGTRSHFGDFEVVQYGDNRIFEVRFLTGEVNGDRPVVAIAICKKEYILKDFVESLE